MLGGNEPETAPDALLSAATLTLTANLRQDTSLQANSPGKIAELVEATILPLFNFRHMTQRAVAPNWRLASPEQQNALIAEFRTLLVRTYSVALANYRDQAIEYKPLRLAPGETDVTVKSTVKQPGAERMTIDYDMEKTPAGWKVYDIKVAGISLITTYRSTFAQIAREGGVDGLIQSLSAKNRQADAGLRPQESGALPFIFMHAVIPSVLRGGR
ncbi:MAG: ABC transporter substrate-binding protein [Pseudomonadota bacterium]